MTDHTPEPWAPYDNTPIADKRPQVEVVTISIADYDRARACVNACAGIPTERLGNVKALVEAAEAELASPGSHTLTRANLNTALIPFRED